MVFRIGRGASSHVMRRGILAKAEAQIWSPATLRQPLAQSPRSLTSLIGGSHNNAFKNGQAYPTISKYNSYSNFRLYGSFWQPTRHDFHTSSQRAMPLKTVEVMSLGERATSGILRELPMLQGSLVEAGDVIAIVETHDQKGKFEIPAPTTGRLTKLHFSVNDNVSVGDTLVTIDTDAVAQSQDKSNTTNKSATPEMSPEVKALLEHISANKGDLKDDYIKEICDTTTDVDTLRSLAALLSERFPPLRVKALPILERILDLQLAKDESMADQAHVQDQATTHTDLGILLYKLGDLDAALAQLECALELRKVALGESHPELSATLIHIGAIHNQKGDMEKCFESFDAALKIQKEHLGEQHPLVAASLNNLGAIRYHQSRFQEAIPFYKEALEIYQQQQEGSGDGDNKSNEIAGTYNNLAVATKHTGDYAAALEYGRTALKIRQEVLGNTHIDTATSHYCLGQLFSETRQFDAALEQMQAALEIQTQVYGVNHATTATTRNNLGAIYYEQGKFEDALKDYQQGLQAFQAAAGKEAPQVADCWNNVGMTQLRLSQFDEALKSHETAKAILEKAFGETHPTLAMTLGSIGTVYKSQRQFDDALKYYKLAHPMLEQALGPNHDLVGSSYNNMGQVLAMQGKLEDALTVYRAALKVFTEAFSKEHVFTASIHYNIGLVLQQQGKSMEEALKEYQEAYQIWKTVLGPEHPQTQLAEQAIDALHPATSSKKENDADDTDIAEASGSWRVDISPGKQDADKSAESK